MIHSHTKNQVNISKHSENKVVTTVLFRNYGMTDMGNTICPGHNYFSVRSVYDERNATPT